MPYEACILITEQIYRFSCDNLVVKTSTIGTKEMKLLHKLYKFCIFIEQFEPHGVYPQISVSDIETTDIGN